MWKAASVDEPAAIISQHSDQPVYAYRWDWDEGAKSWAVDFSQLMGAAHGLEVQYVFGNAASGSWIPGLYNDNNGPGRDKLSIQMQSYWAEFARSGNPGKGSRGDQTEWKAWSNDSNNLMLLDTDADGGLRMVNEPMTVAMLKQRVAEDSFLDQNQKCAHFSELFFHANDGEDYWDPAEFNQLGCAGDAPWGIRVAR
jgi:para-nitrobenzyl esterase